MAWCRRAARHYLNQCWPSSISPYGVTIGHNELTPRNIFSSMPFYQTRLIVENVFKVFKCVETFGKDIWKMCPFDIFSHWAPDFESWSNPGNNFPVLPGCSDARVRMLVSTEGESLSAFNSESLLRGSGSTWPNLINKRTNNIEIDLVRRCYYVIHVCLQCSFLLVGIRWMGACHFLVII